ncbi:uncharacterized protein Z518_01145 [Rhinocladiella mackenziei CBS 650.93]|uniref:Uncharacterized protein n=1 Tax=Rhinocladiella mackenziei CBS 650.93 TaxID=1442369 RepID=A0A0D2IVK7_9EURO|nr:uncharacterized protein Z518_01145 [Rhinocladiella mackenziei CBS 650.93]KIX10064.1 hypothetical protein Z518_01145 [Rhinocladiella mackenziei CBS 650.93]
MASSTRKTPQLEVPSPFVERPKLNTTRTTTHRLPPPALFQGPPSKNASHISLALPGDRVPGAPGVETEHQHRIKRPSRVPPASSFSGPSLRQPAAEADNQRAENLWAEMQKTLADVELSAMNTSHVFGASHAKALEDLRTAQLSLAQTWAKSEADELHEHDLDTDAGQANVGTLETGSSPSQGPKGTNGKPSAFTNNKNLEEETERDIQLARKRREANDRYFQQVNRGVLDVVNKLDEVAGAMRRVERESREIWDESSDESISGSEDGSATDHTGLTDSPVSVRKQT